MQFSNSKYALQIQYTHPNTHSQPRLGTNTLFWLPPRAYLPGQRAAETFREQDGKILRSLPGLPNLESPIARLAPWETRPGLSLRSPDPHVPLHIHLQALPRTTHPRPSAPQRRASLLRPTEIGTCTHSPSAPRVQAAPMQSLASPASAVRPTHHGALTG